MPSRDLADLLPPVQLDAENALAECRAKGLHPLVTCTYRSPEEQSALYRQGRDLPGPIVTNARAFQSMHQFRCALDLVPIINGKPDWNGSHPDWHTIAAIFKEHGFSWGDDWIHFKEMPHFQITNGYPLSHFQNGGTL